MSSPSTTRRRGAPRLNQYELDIEIGRGGFGKVHLATDIKTGKRVAIKIVNKETLEQTATESYFLREAAMSQQLEHRNVVKAIELIDHVKVYGLVMELATGGELFDKIIEAKRFDEKTARNYFQQLCSAVAFLHAHGIVHRDLKAENMLLGGDHNADLKICDLGLARYTVAKLKEVPKQKVVKEDGDEEVIFMSLAGSPDYVAPEVLSPQGYSGTHCDLWSMGVILFFMLSGYLPFYSMAKDDKTKQKETRDRILKGEWKPSRYLTPLAEDLIKSMLVVDPTKRATIADVANHPWVMMDMPEALRASIADSVKQQNLEPSKQNSALRNLSELPTKTAALKSAEELTDPDVYKLVQKAFRACNVGGGGKLTRSEVRDVLIKINKGSPVEESEVDQFFACFSISPVHNGDKSEPSSPATVPHQLEVSEDQFKDGWAKLGPYLKSKGVPLERLAHMFTFDLESKLVHELRECFKELDIDNNGIISVENLLCVDKLNLSKEQAEQLLKAVDADNTNTITFENFVHAVTKGDILEKHPIVTRLQRLDSMFRVIENKSQAAQNILSGFTVTGFREQIIDKLFSESESKIGTHFKQPHHTSSTGGPMSPSASSSPLSPEKNPNAAAAAASAAVLGDTQLVVNGGGASGATSGQETPALQLTSPNRNEEAEELGRMHSSFGFSGGVLLSATNGTASSSYSHIPENLTYLSGEVIRDGKIVLVVGVKFQPSVPGMTRLVVYRISGKTLEFHEWFRSFRELLHNEIVQAMEDCAVVGESELM